MDSITKLRGKLNEAEEILRYVSKELESYSETDKDSRLNFSELKLRGEQYSFFEHPLEGQIFQDEYLAMLIYVISLGGKKEDGWTMLYRIAAGCRYPNDVQNLTTDAMTFTEERISELIRSIYSAELANIFVMDSLLICHNMGADDAQVKFLSGLYELLKVDKNFLTEAIQFVKILDATFWDNPVNKVKPWKFLSAKDIATYIGGAPAASLSEASGLKKNRVVIMNATHTGSSVLLLDDWNPNEILFINCRFEKCDGIYSTKNTVKFAGCVFDQKEKDYKEYDKKYRDLYHFENAAFANCEFKHFNLWKTSLYLGSGLIADCKFEDFSSSGCYALFTIKNAEVTNSQFINCRRYSYMINNDGHSSYTICLIYSERTHWQSNEFTACENFIREHHGRCYSYVLILKQSQCNDCLFNNVTTRISRGQYSYSRGYYYEDYNETSVIGLYESTADNNEGATVSQVNEIKLYDRWS